MVLCTKVGAYQALKSYEMLRKFHGLKHGSSQALFFLKKKQWRASDGLKMSQATHKM